MQGNEIKIIWRFRPAVAPITPFNTYYHVWAHYSFTKANVPQPPCQPYFPDQVYGEPAYYQSNIPNHDSGGGAPGSALQIVPLVRGTPCTPGQSALYRVAPSPLNGDWIRWGEQSALAAGTPRWTLTHIVDNTWGTPLNWNHLIFINEPNDGVWGGGGGLYNGGSPYAQFLPGTWYTTTYSLSSQ